jgi:tripartite ATP-independent transporter DctM subunit
MLIPPSALAVLVGSLAGISIAGLLIAGVLPALLLAVLFVAYVVGRSILDPKVAPPDVYEDMPLRDRWTPFAIYVLPLTVLFAVVIGSLLAGIATPTESAALGSITAVIIGAAYRALSWEKMGLALMETLKLSVMILFIIAASQTFAQVLSFSGATNGLINAINAVDPTPLMVLLGMIAILLFLGCFIDQVSMLMVTVPVFVPLAGAMEINELTLGVVYLLTMEIGLLTPPFGLLLFVMRGVAPEEIRMPQIYASVMPFLLIKLFVLALVVWLPGIGTWLPGLMGR